MKRITKVNNDVSRIPIRKRSRRYENVAGMHVLFGSNAGKVLSVFLKR